MSNQEYKGKGERVGIGAAWIKEGRNGKFLSGKMDFSYSGHLVTIQFIAFKNYKKEEGSKQPDYQFYVEDAFPSKPKEIMDRPKEGK